jgi:hypothetical protein
LGNLKGYFGSAKGYFKNVKGYFRNVEYYFRNVKYYFGNRSRDWATGSRTPQKAVQHSGKPMQSLVLELNH